MLSKLRTELVISHERHAQLRDNIDKGVEAPWLIGANGKPLSSAVGGGAAGRRRGGAAAGGAGVLPGAGTGPTRRRLSPREGLPRMRSTTRSEEKGGRGGRRFVAP